MVFQKCRWKLELGSLDYQKLCLDIGRPATVITISESEKTELLHLVKRCKGPRDVRLRAEIIIAYEAGEAGNDIAQRLGTSKDVCHAGANAS